MVTYLKTVRGFSSNVRYYIIASAGTGFAYFGILAVLYNLFLLRLGYKPELIGQVNGVGQLSWALLALPASVVGRKLGLRNTLILGSLLVAAGNGLFLLVELLPLGSRVAWLFATTIFFWAGAALTTVNGLPFLASVTHPVERSHAIAVSSSSMALAAVAGSLAAGFLPGWLANLTSTTLETVAPYRLAFWLAPLVFSLNAFFYSRTQSAVLVETKTESQKTATPPLAMFLFFGVVVFLQTASEGGVRAFFNIYLDADLGIPTAQIGTLFGVAGLLPIIGSLLMPLLVGRLGSGKAFCLMGLTMATSLTFLGAIPAPLAAAFGFISFNVGSNLAGGVRGLLSQEIVMPRWRTATSAIYIFGLALGWASMALLGSLVISTLRFSGLMYISAFSALASVVLMFTYLRLRPNNPVAQALEKTG